MAPITRSTHPAALWPGVRKFVMDEYTKHPTIYDQIFTMLSSDRAYEEDVALEGFGLVPVKAEGESVVYDTAAQGLTTRYVHVARALGYIITREMLDDNQYKSRSMKFGRALSRSFRVTKEMVAANILNRAFNASYPGADGKELIATDHPTTGGLSSNELTVAADLSEASLEDLISQVRAAKDSRGFPVAIRPRALVVPTGLWADSQRLVSSSLQPGNANNDVNVLKGIFPGGIIENPYLTDPDAWFIMSDVADGLIGFDRTPYEFTQDNDFDTSNAKAKGYERYAFGWTDWRGIWGSAGA